MWNDILDWIGWGEKSAGRSHGHKHQLGHHHGRHHSHDHGHSHGTIDPTIATTTQGIWAIKWSFVILAITAFLQFGAVMYSGSVALLADTIHNVGDAATAIPLWIAFRLARRKPTQEFTYGLGRIEDIAGVTIVLIILISALVAGYEAIDRFFRPQLIQRSAWIAGAGLLGFVGNEVVANLRIRVGRRINSAALIADGYHARTDGLTSLAVVAGAAGVWQGFPLADPIIGLGITVVILGIVWQSARVIFMRLLDGVESETVDEIRHAAYHVEGVMGVVDARARWIGHKLYAELEISVDGGLTVSAANAISTTIKRELLNHLPALGNVSIRYAIR